MMRPRQLMRLWRVRTIASAFRSGVAALLCAASNLAAPVAAAQDLQGEIPTGVYALDPTHATLKFSVRHMGLSNYYANFALVDCFILVAEPVSALQTRCVTTVNSVFTAYNRLGPKFADRDWDRELATHEGLLNADAHPYATFESRRVERIGPNRLRISGPLTLVGIAQPVSFDVEILGALAEHPFAKVPAFGLSARTSFVRSAYGMSFLAPQVVGDAVSLSLDADFTKVEQSRLPSLADMIASASR
ncbi:MAG: YceI family protein [Pseudomonadota bacterium]